DERRARSPPKLLVTANYIAAGEVSVHSLRCQPTDRDPRARPMTTRATPTPSTPAQVSSAPTRSTRTPQRSTSDERREALITAAIAAFAAFGLHGTAVSSITNPVGITQPYAFSLFGSKK